MRDAEHFTVADVGGAAFAPGGDVVGVHFFRLPDLGFVGVVTYGAVRAIRYAFFFGVGGLLLIGIAFRLVVKDTDIE